MTSQDQSSPDSGNSVIQDDESPVFDGGYHAVLVPDVGMAAALRFETIPEMIAHITEHRDEYSQLFLFGPEGRYLTLRSGHVATPWGIYSLAAAVELGDEIDESGAVGTDRPVLVAAPAAEGLPAPVQGDGDDDYEDDDDLPAL